MSGDDLVAADIARLERLHRDILDLCLHLEEAAGDSSLVPDLGERAHAIPSLLKEQFGLTIRIAR